MCAQFELFSCFVCIKQRLYFDRVCKILSESLDPLDERPQIRDESQIGQSLDLEGFFIPQTLLQF